MNHTEIQKKVETYYTNEIACLLSTYGTDIPCSEYHDLRRRATDYRKALENKELDPYTRLILYTMSPYTHFIPARYLTKDARLYSKEGGIYTITLPPEDMLCEKYGLDGSEIKLILSPKPEQGTTLSISKYLEDLIVR